MLQIAVCDDLEVHRKIIIEKLREILKEPYEVREYCGAQAFVEDMEVSSYRCDIALIDIELQEDLSGIDVGSEINRIHPLTQIIYMTAYPKYFSEVYETKHIWCIEKQYLDAFLPKALHKAMRMLTQSRNLHLNISWRKVKYSILQEEIIYIERKLRVSEIHTKSQTYYTSDKLEDLMEQLAGFFTICHRSYIVNMRFIIQMKKTKFVLGDEIEIPISRSRCEEVKKQYSHFLIK